MEKIVPTAVALAAMVANGAHDGETITGTLRAMRADVSYLEAFAREVIKLRGFTKSAECGGLATLLKRATKPVKGAEKPLPQLTFSISTQKANPFDIECAKGAKSAKALVPSVKVHVPAKKNYASQALSGLFNAALYFQKDAEILEQLANLAECVSPWSESADSKIASIVNQIRSQIAVIRAEGADAEEMDDSDATGTGE